MIRYGQLPSSSLRLETSDSIPYSFMYTLVYYDMYYVHVPCTTAVPTTYSKLKRKRSHIPTPPTHTHSSQEARGVPELELLLVVVVVAAAAAAAESPGLRIASVRSCRTLLLLLFLLIFCLFFST